MGGAQVDVVNVGVIHSPWMGEVHISTKLSMCFARCLCSTFSLMPRGCRDCKVL